MKRLPYLLAVGFSAWVLTMSATADEHGDKTRHCLPMAQIDRVEVVDDRTLLFHMHGDKDYVNHLPYRCAGLETEAFIHETSLNQYCDLDTITVYNTSVGMRMASCPLGEFERYTETNDAE